MKSLRLILLMCRLKNSTLSEHLFTNDTDKSANEICSLTVSDSRPSAKSMASWAAADVLNAGLSLAGVLIRPSRKPLQKYQPMIFCHLEDFLSQFWILYVSGRQQAARSQIILIAAGSEIDLSWQQQLLTIRVRERSGVILTGADFLKVGALWFSLTPSRVQFMPTARNLPAYLARIHVKHI